jgi:predicted HTH domain antitoxin
MYRKGEVSLFEAADLTDMHPKEFLDVLIRKNKVNAFCSSA